MAAWMSSFQSRAAARVLATYPMMREPPGEPSAITTRPSPSNTRVGAMELRGRLPGSSRLATGPPSRSGRKEKSVNWLLSRKPRTMIREPNVVSMLVVMATALPSASTTLKWVVETPRAGSSGVWRNPVSTPGMPGCALPRLRPTAISPARRLRYPGSSMPAVGTGTKSGSAM